MPNQTKQKETAEKTHSRDGGKKPFRLGPALIVGSLAALIVLGVTITFVYFLGFYDAVYPNVRLAGHNLGGLSRDAAVEEIKTFAGEDFEGKSLIVEFPNDSVTVDAAAVKAGIDVDAASNDAWNFGHEGGVFERMGAVVSAITAGHEVNPVFYIDRQAVEDAVGGVCDSFNAEKREQSVDITQTHVRIDTGKAGMSVDKEALVDQVVERFNAKNFDNLTAEVTVDKPKDIDIDAIYNMVYKAPVDATLETTEKGTAKIMPHSDGIGFDKEAARAKLASADGEVITIPLETYPPEITQSKLEESLFRDVLSDRTTYLNAGQANRTANVRLAAQHINGTILAPGDIFSYNKVIGQRTAEKGFRDAKIFTGGQIVDDIGGGICQVSSTLYQSVLYANLKIVERHNHSFTVTYVPIGEDATVYYGSLDFRFANDTKYPIKVVAVQKSNYVNIKILGTKTDNYKVKLSTVKYGQIPFQRVEKPTSDLPAGKTEVQSEGHTGYTSETTRIIVDENGNEVSRKFENKSVYKKLDHVILIGGGASPAPSPDLGTPPPPTGSPLPSAPPSTAPASPPAPTPTPAAPTPTPAAPTQTPAAPTPTPATHTPATATPPPSASPTSEAPTPTPAPETSAPTPEPPATTTPPTNSGDQPDPFL